MTGAQTANKAKRATPRNAGILIFVFGVVWFGDTEIGEFVISARCLARFVECLFDGEKEERKDSRRRCSFIVETKGYCETMKAQSQGEDRIKRT